MIRRKVKCTKYTIWLKFTIFAAENPATKPLISECVYCGEFEVYNSTLERCVCLDGIYSIDTTCKLYFDLVRYLAISMLHSQIQIYNFI